MKITLKVCLQKAFEKHQKILEIQAKILQKCVHDGLQKGVEKSTALATDFKSKIGPPNDPKSALGGLLEASWGLLGPSWTPLGALLARFLEPPIGLQAALTPQRPPQGPPNPSKGAPKEPQRVPKQLPKGCQDAFQTIKISTRLANNPTSFKAWRNARSDYMRFPFPR